MSNHNLKVGDELAFRDGYGRGNYAIHEIERITPSGRLVCGHITLNSDLSIRGDRGYGGPYCGEIITDKIREAVRRQNALEAIKRTKFDNLTTDSLAAIVAAINEAKEPRCEKPE